MPPRERKKDCVQEIDCKLDFLNDNQTWILVPQENVSSILTSKWIFRRKYLLDKNDQSFVKFKARLVTSNFKQIQGVYYEETVFPLEKFSILRLVLIVVAHENFELHQMYVKKAFLHGDVNEDISMQQPEGFVDPENSSCDCKLQKALIGLKQAPRHWFAKIDGILCKQLQFQSSTYDPRVYVMRDENVFVTLFLSADDLLITGNPLSAVNALNRELSA